MSAPICSVTGCERPRVRSVSGDGRAFYRAKCRACARGAPVGRVEVEVDLSDDPPARPEPERSAIRTIAILADVHVPEHDRAAWRCALAILRDVRPGEVVLAGDFLELASVSQHGGGGDIAALDQDLAAGRAALAEVRDAIGPDAAITYLEGNHETRLQRFLSARAPSVAAALSIPDGLRLAEIGARWIPEAAQPIERDRLRIYHGHQDFPGRSIPIHHAARVAQLRGRRGSVLAYGHTHLPQTASGRGEDAPVAVGLGCLRSLDPSWLRGYPAGWQHGIGIAYLRPGGACDLYSVRIQSGAAVYGGRLYGGAR